MSEYGLDRREMAAPSWWSRRTISAMLAVAFAVYLAAGALYVPLVFQFWTYPKRWLFIVMVFASLGGIVASRLGRWSLLGVDRKVLVPSFAAVIIVASAAWGYTVLTATEGDYAKMVDGQAYVIMARSLLDQHTLSWVEGQPSEHYGPLYSLYLLPFYLWSRDILATKVAILFMGVVATLAVYLTTRRLYGPLEGLVASAMVLSMPTLLLMSSRNLAEFLLVLLYTLTIYSLYRSLEAGRGRYVILAGLFAGLAYLTKSSTGYLFLFAGLAGFLWRYRHVRLAVFKDRNYRRAVGVFSALVGLWTLRNLYTFWRPYMGRQALIDRWNGDFYFNGAFNYVIPARWEQLLLQSLIFAAFMVPFMLALAWPFLPELRRSLGRLGDERISLLWLATLLPMALGAPLSSIYYIWERYQLHPAMAGLPEVMASYFILNGARYILISVVPLLWLAFEARLGGGEAVGRGMPPSPGASTQGSSG